MLEKFFWWKKKKEKKRGLCHQMCSLWTAETPENKPQSYWHLEKHKTLVWSFSSLPGNNAAHVRIPHRTFMDLCNRFTLDGMKWLISGSIFTYVPSWSVDKRLWGVAERSKSSAESVCVCVCTCQRGGRCSRLHSSSRWSCLQPVRMILRLPLAVAHICHSGIWMILALWLAGVCGSGGEGRGGRRGEAAAACRSLRTNATAALMDLLMLDLVVTGL